MMEQAGKTPVSNPPSPVGSPHSLNKSNEGGFVDESGISGRFKELEPMVRPSITYNSRIEFPQFDGTNPRSWVKKCSKYFSLCKTPENQKVELVSLYMIGRAETWYNGYALVKHHITWEDFVMDICARFRDAIGSQVVEEFNRLTQRGSIDAYLEKFEELKSLMQIKNPLLPSDYFVDSFIGGLSPQIKPFTKAFKPQTLSAAVDYARLQEATVQAMRVSDRPRSQLPYKPFHQKGLLPTPVQNTQKPHYV